MKKVSANIEWNEDVSNISLFQLTNPVIFAIIRVGRFDLYQKNQLRYIIKDKQNLSLLRFYAM